MKTLFFIFLLLHLNICSLLAQEVLPVDSTKKIYKPKGIIFHKYPNLYKSENRIDMTLTLSEVLKAESIFFSKYNKIEKIDYAARNLTAKQVRKKYFNYARQYYGFTDTVGARYLYIQLLNFNISNKEKRLFFSDWENRFVMGYGGFFEINKRLFIVDLTNQKVDLQ